MVRWRDGSGSGALVRSYGTLVSMLRVWGAGVPGPCGACLRLLRPLVVSGLRGMVPVPACPRLSQIVILQAGISGKLDRVSCSAPAKGTGQVFAGRVQAKALGHQRVTDP